MHKMILKYTISFDVFFETPDDEEYDEDELGKIAEDMVSSEFPDGWSDEGILEWWTTSPGYEFLGEIEEEDAL